MSTEIELAFADRTKQHGKELKAAVGELRKKRDSGAVTELGDEVIGGISDGPVSRAPRAGRSPGSISVSAE